MQAEDKNVLRNIVKTLVMIILVAFFLIYVSMWYS